MVKSDKFLKNLVFEGGGVRGIAYAGALKALEQRKLLAGVERVAGTSAGAFMALLLSLEFSAAEAARALRSIHFETLEDKPNPLRIATHYGLYKGDVLYDWIAAQFAAKGLSETITFSELRAQGCRDLKVFATDLTICNVREFSAHETPDATVAGAVRASMSIPLMYAAWQFPDSVPDDHIYVDGGAVYNFPINAFDRCEGFDEGTIGFCFKSEWQAPEGKALGPDRPYTFAKNLFATLLKAQKIDFVQNPAELKRSVLIDDLGYHATELELPQSALDRLFVSGEEATLSFLDSR